MDRASRLRMNYTAMLLRSYSRKLEDLDGTLNTFEEKLRGGRATQEDTLLGILKRNAASEYGRKYGFDRVTSYEDYRSAVPVVQYEDLRPFVERMAAGEADVLLQGKASYFSVTSGTTAAPKFLPGTQQSIVAGCEAILARNGYLRRHHPGAFAGQPLFVVGNAAEGKTGDGVGYGAMTGFAYYVGHIGFSGTPFPYALFTISDYRARYYCILRLALAAGNLSLLSVYNPSTLLLLLKFATEQWDSLIESIRTGGLPQLPGLSESVREELQPFCAANPERAEELRPLMRAGPRKWWPQLTVLMCWKGGSLGFYLEDLRDWIQDLPVRDLGILASEALVTIPVNDTTAGGVLLPESGLFEFVPVGAGDGEARGCWALEQGRQYRLLVTTHGGLYRYDMGDIVRVEGAHCGMPLLSFLHRAGRVHSFTGEKLTEFHVTEAVKAATAVSALKVSNFTAVPRFERPPFYELRLELQEGESTARCGDFMRRVDEELKRVNIEYAGKRDSGRLAPVQLAIVEGGSFERFRRGRTVHDAQYKEAHLVTDPRWGEDMRVVARLGESSGSLAS
jgi:hypothetical protein